MSMPGFRQRIARLVARTLQTFRRPLLIAQVEQRQIEQPFARIVDKIERERAVGAAFRLIVDHEPELADLARRVRPLPLIDQRAQMLLVVEARHAVVGLRRQPRPGNAPAGMRLEHRKAPAAQKAVHQSREEYRFARARQPGDAEPDGRIEQMLAVFDQRTRTQFRLIGDTGDGSGHFGRNGRNAFMRRNLGIGGRNTMPGILERRSFQRA